MFIIAPFLFRVNKLKKFLFHFCSICAILSYINSEVMPVVDMKLLGENIRHVRKIKGLTQEELAKKAGMSTMSIRRYENGERIIKLGALKRIAAALNTPIHNLIPNEPGILDPLLPDGLHGLAPNELKVDEDTLCYMLDQMIEVEQINPGLYQRLKAALYFLAVSSGLEHILVYYGSIYDDDEIDLSSPKAKEIIEKLTSDAIFLMKTREDEFNTRMNTAFFELNFTGQQEAVKRVEELTEIPRYRRQEPTEDTLDSTDGKDTPAAQDAPEGAEEGE